MTKAEHDTHEDLWFLSSALDLAEAELNNAAVRATRLGRTRLAAALAALAKQVRLATPPGLHESAAGARELLDTLAPN